MVIDLGATAEGVARGSAVAAVTDIVVAVIREMVCSTVVADTNGDLPGCRPGSKLSICMREGGNGDSGHLALAVVTSLPSGLGTGGLVRGGGGVG